MVVYFSDMKDEFELWLKKLGWKITSGNRDHILTILPEWHTSNGQRYSKILNWREVIQKVYPVWYCSFFTIAGQPPSAEKLEVLKTHVTSTYVQNIEIPDKSDKGYTMVTPWDAFMSNVKSFVYFLSMYIVSYLSYFSIK
jgi:hypothetical protein